MLWDTVGIIALILLNLLILRALIEITRQFQEGFEELDSKTAAAIASVLDRFGGGEMEPINPVQAAIANLIQMKMENRPDQKSARDDAGKFKITEVLNP